MRFIKIAILPKTRLGKSAIAITVLFIILILLKMLPMGIPVPTFGIVFLGILGFITAIMAVIKKIIL
ncbi:hypothetical protein [Acetobacterium tundrae]|uniref:Uncharacterized protein n=1 Tax=Acetobacterium tundrae TaxID=132932 RepID=A0ABR6WIC6_9FIRM|nr:hypothetical protein [Acetobacterium tundrae]MBC3795910.1 hypothetical protein [Acetobacterium tundrae]